MVKVYSPWHGNWEPFAQALRNSLKTHAPAGWDIDVPETPVSALPASAGAYGPKIEGNVRQLLQWRAAVDKAPDGSRLLLLDTDMYARRPIGGIFEAAGNPDLFYTDRPPGGYGPNPRPGTFKPLSTGVLGVLVSAGTREFFGKLAERALYLVAHSGKYTALRQKYGGIQQPSFGTLLEEGAAKHLHVTALPCAEWNASAPDGFGRGMDSRLVHVHGTGLRSRMLNFAKKKHAVGYGPTIDEWRKWL